MAQTIPYDEFMKGTKPKVVPYEEFTASPEPSFAETMGDNFVGGLEAARDFATFNYKKDNELPAKQNLAEKYKAGTATRQDYLATFLEGGANSPPGKALQAVGGIVPEFNIAGSAIMKYVNPAIVDNTGLTHEDVITAELGLPFLVKGAQSGVRAVRGVEPPVTPSGGGLPVTKAIYNTVTKPVQTALKVGEGVINTAARVASPVTKRVITGDNIITGEAGYKSQLGSPTSLEGQRLGDKLGIEFTAGELTGNKTAMGLEDALANTIRYGEDFAQKNVVKNEAIVNNYKKVLDEIHPSTVSKRDAGDIIASTYNNTINNLVKNRSAQAQIDFEAALSKADGEPNILSNNLFSELQAIKAEGEGKLLTGNQTHAASLANYLLKRVSDKTQAGNQQAGFLNLKDFQAGLSNFSNAAKRSGGALEDAKTAAARRVYARLANALQKDLDAEIVAPRGNPEYAAMLKMARDNFYQNSAKIADIEGTTLGKMIGDVAFDSEGNMNLVPEKVAVKVLNMQPTEIQNTMKFFDKTNPENAAAVRRFVLEEALNNAQEGIGLRGVGTTKEFPRAKFVSSLPEEAKLNALLGNNKAAQDIMDIASATNRLIDRGATQRGSQTAQRLGMFEYTKNAFIKAVVGKSLIDDLLNPIKRQKIINDAKLINRIKNTKIKIENVNNFIKDEKGSVGLPSFNKKQELSDINNPIPISKGVEFDPTRTMRENYMAAPENMGIRLSVAADEYQNKIETAVNQSLKERGYEIGYSEHSRVSDSRYWAINKLGDDDSIIEVRFSDHDNNYAPKDFHAYWGEAPNDIVNGILNKIGKVK